MNTSKKVQKDISMNLSLISIFIIIFFLFQPVTKQWVTMFNENSYA